MPLVKIEGVPPWDGEYPLDLSSLNGRELHQIKQVAGVRANELQDAMLAGDYDLIIAFTLIALERSGKQPPPADVLLDAAVGQIILDDDPAEVEEGDARPPASSPTPNGNESSTGVGTGESAPTAPSGGTSSSTGGDRPSSRSPIGGRGWADSVASDQEMSAR